MMLWHVAKHDNTEALNSIQDCAKVLSHPKVLSFVSKEIDFSLILSSLVSTTISVL